MASPDFVSSPVAPSAAAPVEIPVMPETSPLSAAVLPRVETAVTVTSPKQQGSALDTSTAAEKMVTAWSEVLGKLFAQSTPERPRMTYDFELKELADKHGIEPAAFLASAIKQLQDYPGLLHVDARGHIQNSAAIGSRFSALYDLANAKVDISIAVVPSDLFDKQFPLGEKMAKMLSPIPANGEAITVMLAKEPPLRAAEELTQISKERFGGLVSLWSDQSIWDKVGVSPALKEYLSHATVRIVCTGKDPELNALARIANEQLEQKGGFEDANWTRMIKAVTQTEQAHSLKQTLLICAPVIGAIKLLEGYAPGLVHTVGGVLDDFFGGIVPDVSQSMGRRELPFRERLKDAAPTLLFGVATLPAAALLGWWSSALHAASSSPALHASAGVLFALACSAGTIGTSLGAFVTAYRKLTKLESDPVLGTNVRELGTVGKIKTAIQESVLNVPFRIGHTVIGVPFQIALGVAAGLGGFFHNSAFIMVEGMAETFLGAATAFGLPTLSAWWTRRNLRQLEPGK